MLLTILKKTKPKLGHFKHFCFLLSQIFFEKKLTKRFSKKLCLLMNIGINFLNSFIFPFLFYIFRSIAMQLRSQFA